MDDDQDKELDPSLFDAAHDDTDLSGGTEEEYSLGGSVGSEEETEDDTYI